MGDRKTKREQRSLRLRRESLQQIGWDQLEQVVGGVHLKAFVENGRCLTRYCPY
jgi:hypothetical protein